MHISVSQRCISSFISCHGNDLQLKQWYSILHVYLISTNYYKPPGTLNVITSQSAQSSFGLQLGPICNPCDNGHALYLACFQVFEYTAVCLYIFFSVFLAETSLFLSGKRNGKVIGFHFLKGIYTAGSFSEHGRSHVINYCRYMFLNDFRTLIKMVRCYLRFLTEQRA